MLLNGVTESMAQLRSFYNQGNYTSAITIFEGVNYKIEQYEWIYSLYSTTKISFFRYLKTIEEKNSQAKWKKVLSVLQEEHKLCVSLQEEIDNFEKSRIGLRRTLQQQGPSEVTNVMNTRQQIGKQPLQPAKSISNFWQS